METARQRQQNRPVRRGRRSGSDPFPRGAEIRVSAKLHHPRRHSSEHAAGSGAVRARTAEKLASDVFQHRLFRHGRQGNREPARPRFGALRPRPFFNNGGFVRFRRPIRHHKLRSAVAKRGRSARQFSGVRHRRRRRHGRLGENIRRFERRSDRHSDGHAARLLARVHRRGRPRLG